jgi:acyl-coenzyme A synthetase/AMP-(fatty) acid ligase
MIETLGASVPQALRQRARQRIGATIVSNFGANETSSICRLDENNEGVLLPDVDAEVVDAHDAAVPHGEVGRLRVRATGMVDGYEGDAAATASMFRNGWFYTGDLGVMRDSRTFRLVGRDDDLLNIGGLKCTPEELEKRVSDHTGIVDVAVCSVRNSHGMDEIVVALVHQGSGYEALAAQIHALFEPAFGSVHVARLMAIPRNANGKIDRTALQRLAARAF